VVKPSVPEIPVIDVSKPLPAIVYDDPKESAVLRKERPVAKTVSSEVNTNSTRRRRAPKRRIVDLATNDTPIPHAQPVDRLGSVEAVAPTIRTVQEASQDSHYRISQETEAQEPVALAERPLSATQSSPNIPRIDTSVAPQLPPIFTHDSQSTWNPPQEWDIGGELYRQKIETLRDQVGSGYLSVLGEETWEAPRPTHYQDTSFGAPSPPSDQSTPRVASVQPIHTGRTIG
jgi:hypothetical protein